MFIIESRDKESKARSGVLKTAHGDIPTPIFMPVGTGGTVKGILQRDLSEDIRCKNNSWEYISSLFTSGY